MKETRPESVDEQRCKFCKNTMNLGARICANCGRDQNIILGRVQPDKIGVIVSVIMVIIALVQLNTASKERKLAKEAFQQAQAAIEEIKTIQQRTVQLEKEARKQVLTTQIGSREQLVRAILLTEELFHIANSMAIQSEDSFKGEYKIEKRISEYKIEKRISMQTAELKHEIATLKKKLDTLK